ncbi:MAG: CHAT domain-containing protein [Myxococcota bacterium]
MVARPRVLMAGCDEILLDGTCERVPGAGPLRVWIDQHEHARIGVRVDGAEVTTRARGVDGGLLLEIELPASARALAVQGVDPRWHTDWELAIRHDSPPAVVTATDPLVARGDFVGAIEQLESALEGLTDADRLAVLQRLQALHFERQQLLRAAQRSAQVVDLAQRMHRRRTAAWAASTCVFIYAYRRREIAAARPFLDVLDHLAPSVPEATVWAAFSHGIVARSVGDTTRALESFREAAQVAERLGMHVALLSAREGLAITYGELARGRDAVALARRMLTDAQLPGLDCSLRYSVLNTAGWVQLLLQQRQVDHLPPTEFFERALSLVDPDGECPDPNAEINVRINLALTSLAESEPAMALLWLDPIELVPSGYRSWVQEVEARAGLALGRWERVPSPLLRPDPRLPRAERWNAWMRQATVLDELGMRQAAIDAYVDAEAIVEESVAAIGVDLGRELFLSGRQASARGLVRRLVEVGRESEALCYARLARGRALRMLDRTARLSGASPDIRQAWEADVAAVAELRRRLDAEAAEDWKLSVAEQSRRQARRVQRQEHARRQLDRAYERLGATGRAASCGSLPALGDREVMLALFPADAGWLVFVSDGTTVVARPVRELPLGGPGDVQIDQALWGQGLNATIAGAHRLRVLPTGRSWDVPFHAMAWGDGVLLDVAPVAYALDLVRSPEPSGIGPGTALVVADPREDLPLARDESDRVEATLRASAWTVERLEGHAATRARVEASLAAVDLLHYAGHGEHGGVTGWGARLLMGEGEGFGITDILALPRAPAAVVLSGCETGRVTRETLEGGMNLGRAFILAGSEWVVSTDRRVSDELSAAVGQALYEELGAVGWDGPQALRRVQQRLRASQPSVDWAAFRAVVR